MVLIWMYSPVTKEMNVTIRNNRMTRRECYEFRGRCFEYLLSQGILPSSEEVSDWAVPSLVFCHYAPYDFMMKKREHRKKEFRYRYTIWYIMTV